uniref:Ribosome biogenesis protein BMS1/TSR1 C-terminal domain-containing protein n=1 Tax=Cebus imitator TaxID=2715852 RepID=A0A2K5QMC5_CEBIM
MFDAECDEGESTYFHGLKGETQKQAQVRNLKFEDQDGEDRAQYEGFRPGIYIHVEIENVPCKFVQNFDPHYPIILGGLGNSPVIFSVGWRRFQNISLYYIKDHNGRQRLLKYMPQHMHCGATFWGKI